MIALCLTLSNIRYVSRVKWSHPGKRVLPSPKHRCSSYWKEILLVVLNYCRQLYIVSMFHGKKGSLILIHSQNYIVCPRGILLFSSNYNVIYPFSCYSNMTYLKLCYFHWLYSVCIKLAPFSTASTSRGGATPFPGFFYFTLDTYLIMLSVKQASIKSIFNSLVWLDLGLNPRARAFDKHSNHRTNVRSALY